MIVNPFSSSIGKKAVMAVTGLMLLGFLIAHMLGNFQIFFGPDMLNSYAQKLRSMPAVLWTMRIGLLVVFVTHVLTAICLAKGNREARPIGYKNESTIQATYASRLMLVSGLLLLLYIVYHLAHFTWGVAHPEHFHYVDSQGRHDVYSMVVASFQNITISTIYLIAMGALCFHLKQAASVFAQSLGLINAKGLELCKKIGNILALVLFVGYASIPLAVLFEIVKLPN